ncbi:hypothetical protein [Polyangium sorediatum]|uniref:hypothetical protein n=1 Tax=Polyangium sorediatum TaxID=889274 RepID=UPI0011334F64|nr:hypothetical protein [Polyangium sorediatum]
MMQQWRHSWFGFWREGSDGCEECPSVFDWIDPEWKSGVDVDRVVRYLESSPYVLATSADACAICRNVERVALAYRTDGAWYWPDDLAHYIVQHEVRLPDEFHARILGSRYTPPKALWQDERGLVDLMKRLNAPPKHMAELRHLAENR